MSSLVSLPVYDIFAYLMVGIATIAAADLIFGTRFFFRSKWDASTATVAVVAGYLIGQVIGIGAVVVLERAITTKTFGWPMSRLFDGKNSDLAGKNITPPNEYLKYISPTYFEPLQPNDQTKIRTKAGGLTGDDLFWAAYNTAKQDKEAYERITLFSRQYHYSCNMAFASLLCALAVLLTMISRKQTGKPKRPRPLAALPSWLTEPRWQLVIFAVAAAALYLRYLYYFRAHTIEILTSYAYGKG